ncbi:hypothetical protein M192_gp047 [Halorubrum tailed phage 8]|uniref:Uncharacterized protein n=1 Tax=Halorubrum tailed phage 8 TaxID=2847109 RepID=R4TJL8_9CAUD|nr:hypothetical protein M192_gp047 [Halorubrum tailed phage 8]AGM10832.1 hypothetical protein HRTV8_88 [Halorubrum tailed phage 8]
MNYDAVKVASDTLCYCSLLPVRLSYVDNSTTFPRCKITRSVALNFSRITRGERGTAVSFFLVLCNRWSMKVDIWCFVVLCGWKAVPLRSKNVRLRGFERRDGLIEIIFSGVTGNLVVTSHKGESFNNIREEIRDVFSILFLHIESCYVCLNFH